MNAATRLLRDLVAIPSVNPQGIPGTDKTGEGEIAKFIGDFLRGIGADVEFQFVHPNRPTVIGKLAARGVAKRAIAFAPHTDTVSVAGMSIAPFDPIVRRGRLYGRGASDTKGSLAAMLTAMQQLATSRTAGRDSDIYMIGLMGEESGQDGVRVLMMHKPPKLLGHIDFAIVGEPTQLEIVTAHKGTLWFRLITHGRSCHGATPEDGSNAISKMNRIMHWLEHTYMPRLKRRRNSVLGHATLNIGTIRGGSKVNIVPDRCELELDHRTLPGDVHSKILRMIRSATKAEVEIIGDFASMQTPKDLPFVQQLQAAGAGCCVGSPWFSDAAVFAAHGIPAVCFGPGSIAQAHTRDEFISLSQLSRSVAIIDRFLKNLS